MYGKRKSGVFLAVRVGFQAAFWKFHSAGTYMTSSQHSNIQVTITVMCLNFAVSGSRILLPAVSSCRRVKPSRKIALNSNGEVNYRELARRPCNFTYFSTNEMIMWISLGVLPMFTKLHIPFQQFLLCISWTNLKQAQFWFQFLYFFVKLFSSILFCCPSPPKVIWAQSKEILCWQHKEMNELII